MNRVDEIDRIYSNIRDIYDKIEKTLSGISRIISNLKTANLEAVSTNVGNTLNNKIIQIEKYFKENNIDFYNETILKFVIEKDLMKKGNDALNIISKYYLELNIYMEEKIKNSSFFGIRSKKQKAKDIERIKFINKIIEEYNVIDSVIEFYNIEENILDSIMYFIESRGHDWFRKNIGDITNIEDELSKLQLNDLVIRLEDNIKKKGYYDILPNFDSNNNYFLVKEDIKIISADKKIKKEDLNVLREIKEMVNNTNQSIISTKGKKI